MANDYDPCSEDRHVKVLRCMHRDDTRAILRSLEGISERGINDLTRQLATEWRRTPQEVHSILCEQTLPLLENAALVVYDRDTGVIERGDAYEEVERFLVNSQ